MIIHRKKDINRELRRCNKVYKNKFATYGYYDISLNAFQEIHFIHHEEKNLIYKLFNKAYWPNDKIIRNFKAGTIPKTNKDLWIERSIYFKNMFIVDSPVPSEKASFIYTKKLLARGEKFFYLAEHKECVELTKKCMSEYNIPCIFLDKICFRAFKIDSQFHLFIYNIIQYRIPYILKKIDYYKLSLIIDFLFQSRNDIKIEFTKKGIDYFIANIPSDFSKFTLAEQESYLEVKKIITEEMVKMKIFLCEIYDEDNDIFYNLMLNDNIIIPAKNTLMEVVVMTCVNLFFENDLPKKCLMKGYQYPKIITPCPKHITYSYISCFKKDLGISYIIYSDKEEENKNMPNVGLFLKHNKGNLYNIKTQYDDKIIDISK